MYLEVVLAFDYKRHNLKNLSGMDVVICNENQGVVSQSSVLYQSLKGIHKTKEYYLYLL